MKMFLLAAIATPIFFTVLPGNASADAPKPIIVQWDGESHPHGDWDRRHDDERHRQWEAEQAARWESFFHARMHEHFEREGYSWANLPHWQKEQIIREEWERWGERRWGR